MLSIVSYLSQTWLIGIAIAAPVGPIGMLCIKKTLELGKSGTIAVGLGAALADSVYGLIAALGLSAASNFLVEKATFIKIIGGVFLLYLAYKEIKNTSKIKVDTKTDTDTLHIAIKVFFLTLTNPMTILTFLGIFASIAGNMIHTIEALTMVAGIF